MVPLPSCRGRRRELVRAFSRPDGGRASRVSFRNRLEQARKLRGPAEKNPRERQDFRD